MATRTLKAKYEPRDDSINHSRAIFCHAKNAKEIYYQFEDEAEAPPVVESSAEVSAAPTTPAPAVVAAAPSPAVAAASVEDVPIKAIEVLLVVIAQKLKKKVDEVPLSKSIKELVGGTSTLQNEILGDLQIEFSTAPEKGEELPLEELGSALAVGFSGNLGKYTNGLIARECLEVSIPLPSSLTCRKAGVSGPLVLVVSYCSEPRWNLRNGLVRNLKRKLG
jgi:fatty acid synthase subunit alpha, fungi type